MKSRREFIKTASKGAAFSTLALTSAGTLAAKAFKGSEQIKKPLRIGIIGAENSHTSHFGRIFNIDKQFPGVSLDYVWGETKELALKAQQKSNIPYAVKTPGEMLGKIDALIVDHRHPKYHLEPAIPFIKEGIPTFIDKPFCNRLDEGIEFLALARKHGAPVTSFSTIANSAATFDIKKQLENLGEIRDIVRYGPADLDSKYGGIFFYGVHLVQPLMYMFGDEIERVKVTRNENHGSANLVFKSGLFATLIFRSISYGWNTFIDTHEGLVELKPRVDEPTPHKADTDIVKMFKTGKEPRSHESILKTVAVLKAMDKSSQTENWVEVANINWKDDK